MPLTFEAPGALDHGGRTRVLIVRHAQSTFNMQLRHQGRSDEPVLTDRGTATAVQTGQDLANERIDAVVSSPLRRALQTAEIITAVLSNCGQDELRRNTSADLMEIDLPQWQGLGLDAVRQQFPNDYRIWTNQPHEFRMSAKAGTSFFPVRELFGQVRRFWQEFLFRYGGQTVALVTHGGTARALVSTAVDVKPARFHSFQQSNCGISVLEFTPGASTVEIEALNLTRHLGECMPKLKLGRRGLRIVMVSSDTPWQQAGHVSGALATVQLDFVSSADDPQSTQMAYALIKAHPDAQLRVFPGNALFDYQHPETTPRAGSIASSRDSLSTGVLVGRNAKLDSMLSAVMGIEGKNSPWKHSSNAVLHYPGTGRIPVIQAFNIPIWKEVIEPVIAEVRA